MRVTRALAAHVQMLQRDLVALGELAGELALRERQSDLRTQLGALHATTKAATREADKFTCGVQFVATSLDTLVSKTMADSLATCAALEQARVEYDGERNHVSGGETGRA